MKPGANTRGPPRPGSELANRHRSRPTPTPSAAMATDRALRLLPRGARTAPAPAALVVPLTPRAPDGVVEVFGGGGSPMRLVGGTPAASVCRLDKRLMGAEPRTYARLAGHFALRNRSGRRAWVRPRAANRLLTPSRFPPSMRARPLGSSRADFGARRRPPPSSRCPPMRTECGPRSATKRRRVTCGAGKCCSCERTDAPRKLGLWPRTTAAKAIVAVLRPGRAGP